ncbi:Uncharacterized protein TCM_040398 [Theobroma cacao]|uniref:Uncharacterized protein n=1 Tax=Theobroma cacao TaxID=3641 RepID=A0A061GRG7_THECC|nr:Uncharacterized protein TCM_040398 [Theobroma cacao]
MMPCGAVMPLSSMSQLSTLKILYEAFPFTSTAALLSSTLRCSTLQIFYEALVHHDAKALSNSRRMCRSTYAKIVALEHLAHWLVHDPPA